MQSPAGDSGVELQPVGTPVGAVHRDVDRIHAGLDYKRATGLSGGRVQGKGGRDDIL